MKATKSEVILLATNGTQGLFAIGQDVYRSALPVQLDIYGEPMGKRWECSLDQYHRYRATVFGDWTLTHGNSI